MRVACIAAALLSISCSALAPRLEPPNLSVVNVELMEGSLWEQSLRVRMRVQNPNDRTLPVRGLTYALEVAGEELAQGVSDRSFVVPALGETEFDMTVRTNMALALLKLADSQGGSRAADGIEYRLHGKVSLSEGVLRSIPFHHSGTFQLQ